MNNDMTGWRLLEVGETIQECDEYQVEILGDEGWERVWGAGDVIQEHSTPVRRRVEACLQDAQLYVSTFKAIVGLQIMAGATAWRIDRDNAVITAKLWRGSKVYQCERTMPVTPLPSDVLSAIVDAVEGVKRIIDTQAHGVG